MRTRTRSIRDAVPTPAPEQPAAAAPAARGRVRVVIEAVQPYVDGGRFPVKRVVGDVVQVEADVFCDGHDHVSAALFHRRTDATAWTEADMTPLVNDRWAGRFVVEQVGRYEFKIVGWVNYFATWRHNLEKRIAAEQDVSVDLQIGAGLVERAAKTAAGDAGRRLTGAALRLRSSNAREAASVALDERLARLMHRHAERCFAVESGEPVPVWVDRKKAGFSAWYELFPRSAAPEPGRHGTFRDVEARLDGVAAMGFDVLYFPPIHPIGRAFRKGKNNTLDPGPDDVGSPWAIGSEEGGHDAIHPALGTVADFEHLVRAAESRGVEIALDLAFQCSPDHPYVREHPEWFRTRPDGSIQYAENPPKKYQDIYPFDFECAAWESLWRELKRVVCVWIDRGVRIFRVDNPHTKPFAFWEWLIAEIKRDHPDVLFLSEAFTRPKVMYRLAKIGFSQSYTYFAWRDEPWGIRQYFTELTTPPLAEFFRPNVWPNTPDILTAYLQTGGRGAFMARAVLATTLSANYGLYGPAFELMEHRPLRPGSEEYLDSEKYQIRHWPRDRSDSLREFLTRLNRIRRENPALQQDRTLRFHPVDNPAVVCYSKAAGENTVLVAVNTDPHHHHWANVELDLGALGLSEDRPFRVHDQLTNEVYRWHGRWNVVGLDPASCPAHVFRVARQERTESDFETF